MSKTIAVWVLTLAVIGSVAAGWLAQRRQTTVTQTAKIYVASVVNPGNLLAGPRTYNQTLADSTDPAQLATELQTAGYPASSTQIDVLPDSFTMQVTVSLTAPLTAAQATALGEATATNLNTRSHTLSKQLFTATSAAEPTVALTRVLPVEASYNQRPTTAALFGALAGALVGLFIGLALTDPKRT